MSGLAVNGNRPFPDYYFSAADLSDRRAIIGADRLSLCLLWREPPQRRICAQGLSGTARDCAALLAKLPQKLLQRGGALAAAGHVERLGLFLYVAGQPGLN